MVAVSVSGDLLSGLAQLYFHRSAPEPWRGGSVDEGDRGDALGGCSRSSSILFLDSKDAAESLGRLGTAAGDACRHSPATGSAPESLEVNGEDDAEDEEASDGLEDGMLAAVTLGGTIIKKEETGDTGPLSRHASFLSGLLLWDMCLVRLHTMLCGMSEAELEGLNPLKNRVFSVVAEALAQEGPTGASPAPHNTERLKLVWIDLDAWDSGTRLSNGPLAPSSFELGVQLSSEDFLNQSCSGSGMVGEGRPQLSPLTFRALRHVLALTTAEGSRFRTRVAFFVWQRLLCAFEQYKRSLPAFKAAEEEVRGLYAPSVCPDTSSCNSGLSVEEPRIRLGVLLRVVGIALHLFKRPSSDLAHDVITGCTKRSPQQLGLRQHWLPRLAYAMRIVQRKDNIIILVAGAAGCGKSTLACLLASHLGLGTVLSTDTVRHILRSTCSKESNPILYASTYETQRYVCADTLAKKEQDVMARMKNVKAFQASQCAGGDEWRENELPVGYILQAEMLYDRLAFIVDYLIHKGESVVLEGVHITGELVERLMDRYPRKCIPFLVYIEEEAVHAQRFASRSRNFETDPQKNKYIQHISHIREIQSYLLRSMPGTHVTYVENSVILAAIRQMHQTVVQHLHPPTS